MGIGRVRGNGLHKSPRIQEILDASKIEFLKRGLNKTK
jgi:hypothetical protein